MLIAPQSPSTRLTRRVSDAQSATAPTLCLLRRAQGLPAYERRLHDRVPLRERIRMTKTAFFAYPGQPQFIGNTIHDMIPMVRSANDLLITPWPKLNIIGLKLDNLIRERVASADLILADVTYPNFNVYYEIGYSVGRQKPFVITMNYAVDESKDNINLTGLFDTIGYLRYQNSQELAIQLGNYDGYAWTNEYLKDKDHAKPLFLLEPLRKFGAISSL
jgi:hypothetical protein